MIQIIWQFDVADMVAFEKIYGSKGLWVELFQQSPDYHGTVLLKDCKIESRYLTIDRWNNETAFQQFKKTTF